MKTSGFTVNRRRFVQCAAAGTAMLLTDGLAVACGSTGGDTQKIDMAISHWPTLFRNLPWMVATEQGLWQKRNLRIGQVLTSAGGGETLRNMSLGDLPFADAAAPAAISAFYAGIPLKVLGSTAKLRGVFMTRPDSTISSPHDIAGHKIGYSSPGSVSQAFEFGFLAAAGILDKVTLVATGAEQNWYPALQRGIVDIILCPANVMDLVRAGKVKAPFKYADVSPTYVDTSLVASGATLKSNPALIQQIIDVETEAVTWILNNQQAGAKIFAKYAKISEQAAADQVQLCAPLEDFWSPALPVEYLEQLQSGMFYTGTLPKGPDGKPKPIDFSQILDYQFVPAKDRGKVPGTFPLPAAS
jgi:NitT/TauT family transport system substrate-binding protein